MSFAIFCGSAPLVRTVRCRTVAKTLSMEPTAQMRVFRRVVVEGEQRLAVLAQACHRLFVFGTVFLGEGVHGGFRSGAGFSLPDLVQIGLYLRLHGLRELVQDPHRGFGRWSQAITCGMLR